MLDRVAAVDWRQVAVDVLLFIALTPFWLAGWIVGIVWAIILYTSAAIVAGFKAGAYGKSD
jgi:hypothetical protein